MKIKHKIQNICDVRIFESLLETCMLSDTEKTILRLHYIQKKDFRYIGDTLGFSESTMKRKHGNILKKLNKLI